MGTDLGMNGVVMRYTSIDCVLLGEMVAFLKALGNNATDRRPIDYIAFKLILRERHTNLNEAKPKRI